MPATEDYLRNIKTMHKVFCLSAVVLLACTVWMMWADYVDEWRGYQRQAQRNVADRDRSRINAIQADPKFKADLAVLEQAKKSADEALKAHQTQLDELKTA